MDHRQYLRQFLTLFTGTAMAQVFNLASYPLLARLYSPTDFGMFGVFIAASAIPSAIACGRFELAIATAPHSGRRAMLWLCYTVALVISLVATLLMSIYWWQVETPALGLLAPMLFLTVLLTGISNATTMYLIRRDAFHYASAVGVMRTAITVIVQLTLALVWGSAAGLIIGFNLGLVAQAAFGIAIAARAKDLGRPQLNRIRAMFRRFRPQVSVDVPGTLLAALSFNLIPLILQQLYGDRAAGFFSMGQRIAVVPLQLFNNSLSQVFFQRAARAQEQRGEFWSEFRFNLFTSGTVSLAMLVGLILFAKPILALYLGAEWEMAGSILVILAPMLAIGGVSMSLATTVFVLKRPSWLLYHNIASLSVIGLSFGLTRSNDLSLLEFLELLALLQGIEYAAFGLILAIAARRRYLMQQAITRSIAQSD